MTTIGRTELVFFVVFFAFVSLACVSGAGLGAFDAVDEDYSRPSPPPVTQSALRKGCDAPIYQTEEVFEHALCLCGDLKEVGQGLTTRSASALAGTDSGLGHVGINGELKVVGNFTVDGSLDVAGGINGVGALSVGDDLISGNNVEVAGSWDVDGNAWVDGDLKGVGSMNVGGDLYLTGDLKTVGNVNFDKGRKGFKYRGTPCGCAPSDIIDVAAEIAKRKDDNDNDLIVGAIGAGEVVLESGEYYFGNSAELVGSSHITVRGRVAIFAEGDIEAVGALNIDLEKDAELELWVSGTIKTVGNLRLAAGDNARPRAFKLYMGGAGSALVNVGSASLVGAIYAPQVDIEYVGNLDVHGSLFANNLKGTGNLSIVYDTDIPAPDECVDAYYQTQGE